MTIFPGIDADHWLDAEPSDAELSAIEAEWPQIQAEMDQLDFQLERLHIAHRLETPVKRSARRRAHRVLSATALTAVA